MKKLTRRRRLQALAACSENLKNGFITELWDCVLSRFDAAAKLLQSASLSLNTVVKMLLSSKRIFTSLTRQFDNYEALGKNKTDKNHHQAERRRTRCRYVTEKTDYASGLTSAQ